MGLYKVPGWKRRRSLAELLTRSPITDHTLAMDVKQPDNFEHAESPNDVRLTRAYLESITTDELMKMADNFGIDIPPELDRIFIIEELLEYASPDFMLGSTPESSDSFDTEAPSPGNPLDENDDSSAGLIETAPLPKQYSITFIEAMIRDPLWAFVFWEIKTQDREQIEKNQDFEGYYLKVSSLDADGNGCRDESSMQAKPLIETEKFFTVPVGLADSAWYLGFTPDKEDISDEGKKQYNVELCAHIKGEETILASSNTFMLPGLYEPAAGKNKLDNEKNNNPLVRLSGYGDFHILHYSERLFRTKKDGSAGSL